VKSSLLFAAAVASVMCIVAEAAVADDDMSRIRHLRDTQSILSLTDILASVEKKYPGTVLDVELEEEHGQIIYEIELLGRNKKIHHLKIDARSGKMIRKGDD
jgi:uncharacterized membrane protein YkoI